MEAGCFFPGDGQGLLFKDMNNGICKKKETTFLHLALCPFQYIIFYTYRLIPFSVIYILFLINCQEL